MKKRIDSPILIGGAIGTELQRRGVSTSLPLWSAAANLTDVESVQEIYEDYLRAGVEIVVTNTFRTTEWTLSRANGYPVQMAEKLTQRAVAAVERALQAVRPAQYIQIAGSVAPLEDCYRPDITPPDSILWREHTKNILQLLSSGKVDLILAETQNSIREASIIVRIAKQYGVKCMVSFVADGEALLSGEHLQQAVIELQRIGVEGILLNCQKPSGITTGMSILQKNCTVPFGGYGNGINHMPLELCSKFHEGTSDDERYAEEVARWVESGATFIGGCCGTTPSTMRYLQENFCKHYSQSYQLPRSPKGRDILNYKMKRVNHEF